MRESAPRPQPLTAAQAVFLRRVWQADKGLGVSLRMAKRLTVSTWTLGMIEARPVHWDRRKDAMRFRITESGRISLAIHAETDRMFAELPLCWFGGCA